MTLDIEHFQKVTLLREMEDRGEGRLRHRGRLHGIAYHCKRETAPRELKMSSRGPYSSSLYAKYSGDMPAWAFARAHLVRHPQTSCASAPGDGATGSRPPTTTSSA